MDPEAQSGLVRRAVEGRLIQAIDLPGRAFGLERGPLVDELDQARVLVSGHRLVDLAGDRDLIRRLVFNDGVVVAIPGDAHRRRRSAPCAGPPVAQHRHQDWKHRCRSPSGLQKVARKSASYSFSYTYPVKTLSYMPIFVLNLAS
jgi:hypothetical protein